MAVGLFVMGIFFDQLMTLLTPQQSSTIQKVSGQLLRNVNLVQKNLNQALEVSAIVCVMYDARTKLSDQVVQEVKAHFGEKVCRTIVPRTVRLSEAPSFGQPITAFDPTSRGAIAYRELAKEITGGTPQRTG